MDNLYNYNMYDNFNYQFVCPLMRQMYGSMQSPVKYYDYLMRSSMNPNTTTYGCNYDYTSYTPMTFVPLTEVED